MKKVLIISFVCILFFYAQSISALELSLRSGAAVKAIDWYGPGAEVSQLKLGLNLSFLKDAAKSGFVFSSSVDIGLLNDNMTVWIIPEVEYHIPLGSMPLKLYPKIGLIGLWGRLKNEDLMALGIRPTVGIRSEISDRFFVFAEIFGVNMLFFRYYYGAGSNSAVGNVNRGGLALSYDVMFGIGYKFSRSSYSDSDW